MYAQVLFNPARFQSSSGNFSLCGDFFPVLVGLSWYWWMEISYVNFDLIPFLWWNSSFQRDSERLYCTLVGSWLRCFWSFLFLFCYVHVYDREAFMTFLVVFSNGGRGEIFSIIFQTLIHISDIENATQETSFLVPTST